MRRCALVYSLIHLLASTRTLRASCLRSVLLLFLHIQQYSLWLLVYTRRYLVFVLLALASLYTSKTTTTSTSISPIARSLGRLGSFMALPLSTHLYVLMCERDTNTRLIFKCFFIGLLRGELCTVGRACSHFGFGR